MKQLFVWINLVLFLTQIHAANLMTLNRSVAEKEIPNGQHIADFTLSQSWESQPSGAIAPTAVSVYQTTEGIHVIATLEDFEIFSDADAINQETWRLGDVFEVFIAVAGEETYRELHITPNNQKLQLQWTADALEQFRAGSLSLQNQLIAEPNLFTSNTRIKAEQNYWQVSAFIPFASIISKSTEEPLLLEVAFCRYDATRGKPNVLSASAPFTARNFHQREAWHTLHLKQEQASVTGTH